MFQTAKQFHVIPPPWNVNKFLHQFCPWPKMTRIQNNTKVKVGQIGIMKACMKGVYRNNDLSTTCQCQQLLTKPCCQCKLTSIVQWPIKCLHCWNNALRECELQWCWDRPSIFLTSHPPTALNPDACPLITYMKPPWTCIPVSARSRWSYEKNRDCEQSINKGVYTYWGYVIQVRTIFNVVVL